MINNYNLNKLTLPAFLVSLTIMVSFTFVISTGLFTILNSFKEVNFFILWPIVSSIFFCILTSINYAVNTLPLKKSFNIGSLKIDNSYFFKPELAEQRDEEKYYTKFKELEKEYYDLQHNLDDLYKEITEKTKLLDNEYYLSNIFIRHHVNSSRLIRSFANLMKENNSNWKYEFINNVLDECCTILMNNDADKSSSVYFIENEHLKMYAYNRIEFSSSRNRKFKKGEGFAGEIWNSNESKLINDISNSKYFEGRYTPKHKYGSIIGLPISIGDTVYGVLNIQGEDKNAFNEDDLTSARFYAEICALAHLYDILKVDK